MSVAAVIPAAGRGKRLGAGTPKAFYPILGKPLLLHTLSSLLKTYPFVDIVVAVHPKEILYTQSLLKKFKLKDVRVVAGGATRAESVRNAVNTISSQVKWVLVHDAARPLVTTEVVRKVLAAATKADGAIAAIPISSTVKKAKPGTSQIIRTEDRSSLYLAQTPQVFKLLSLRDRYRVLGSKTVLATDEAALFDGTKARILLSEGEARNIKITTPEDVEWAKYYLGGK